VALTAWKSLTSQGVIADTPAAGFRYKYAANFEVYLGDSPGGRAAVAWSALGAGIPTPGLHSTSFKGRWKLRIITPSEETIFEQEVELTYWFVALLMAMFGGVAFSSFTWWISAENITTTVCGHRLEEGEKPAILGGAAEVGYADPAGGADYTTDTAYFWSDWISPVYLLNIPAGSRIKIDFHNIGLSGLRSSLAAVQTQVVAATGAFCRLPGYGMLVGARAGSDGMEAYAWHAPWGAPPDLEWDEPLWSSGVGTSGGRAVWVPYVGGGRVALLWEGLGAILYAESDNLADADGWEGPATVLPGHTLLGADRDTDGTLYILARNGDGQVVGYRASRSLNREVLLRLSQPTPCMMADGSGALSLTSVDYFEVDHGVAHVVVDRGSGLDYYQGMNGLATWHRHVDEGGE